MKRTLVLVLTVAAGVVRAEDPSVDLAAQRRLLDSAPIDVAHAHTVGRMKLEVGPMALEIKGGIVYPVESLGATPAEFVFVGRARLAYDPGDPVERRQVELFTGTPVIDETITEAVLVVANDAAAASLTAGPPLPADDPGPIDRARARLDTWRAHPVRKLARVDMAMLVDRLEAGSYDSYFAGWMLGETQGDIFVEVDPDAREQVQIGQFVPREMTDLQKQAVEISIKKQQDKGRMRDFDIADVGSFDVWVSAPGRAAAGKPAYGTAPFQPVRYSLDVTIDRFPIEVKSVTKLTARAVAGRRRTLRLAVSSDTRIVDVRQSVGGGRLPFVQAGSDLLCLLPQAPDAWSEFSVEVVSEGQIIENTGQGGYALRNTVGWHPRIDTEDGRATFEATFHIPKGFDIVGSGRVVDSGEQGDKAWQKRVLDVPAAGFTFEFGKFHVETVQAGHVKIAVAFDPVTKMDTEIPREDVVKTIGLAFEYYEEKFGPYPLDYATIATVNRGFSQGLLSFLTLATGELASQDWLRKLVSQADARTVIAHEIAHQWWGNLVGWRSYRDQWISEAMATYASNRFARDRLTYNGRGQVRIGMTGAWRKDLLLITRRGVPVDAIGPVILGRRLATSFDDRAYTSIVYLKGAVVLDMLARSFPSEKAFTDLLRGIVHDAANQAISTEEFLAMLEARSGQPLGPFAERFIYGTGIPDVFYRYAIEKSGPSAWRVKGWVRPQTPVRQRVRIVAADRGGFDVRRIPEADTGFGRFVFVAPTQIGLIRPSEDPPKKNATTSLEKANAVVNGRLVIGGEKGDFDIGFQEEPTGFWLDLNREVYAFFYDEQTSPKKALYYLGLDEIARGEIGQAEATLRRAIETKFQPPTDVPKREEERDAEKFESRLVNTLGALALARLSLDADRVEEGAAFLAEANTTDPEINRFAVRELLEANARMALRRGNPREAQNLLMKKLFPSDPRERVHDAEAFALLAIAAKANADEVTYKKAAILARKFGVDVSALTAE